MPYIAVTGILMWGCGDAAAALIGGRFGKHHVNLPFADRKKTWEGFGGMVLFSSIAGTLSMLAMTAGPWYACLAAALAGSIAGAYAELISHRGMDTVTVPVVNVAVLLALHAFASGIF